MNLDLARSIVAALGVTGSSEEPLQRLGKFRRREWERTLAWLDDSGLALYLLEQVNRASATDALPEAVRGRLERNLASNRQRLAAMTSECDTLNGRLQAAGVEFAVLKGLALEPDFCPDAALRSQYDYDYLVRPKDDVRAREALEATGYARKVQSPGYEPEGASLFAPEPLSYPSADEDFYSARLARRVELHLSLWEYGGIGVSVDLPQDLLDRRQTVERHGLRFPVLAAEDALLAQVVHAFHHMLDHWCRPSCFLEIAYFVGRRHEDRAFWERFLSRVEGRRPLAPITGLVLSMSRTIFRSPIPDEIAPCLAQNPVLDLWVRKFGARWALAPFPGSKLSVFMHREFMDDPARWKAMRRSRLLPFHRPAQVVETGDAGAGERWSSRRDQGRFVAGRVRFHFQALASYLWSLPGWKRALRRLDAET